MKYLEYIKESRYKTHGLITVKRQLPVLLNSINAIYDIEYYDTDDFSLSLSNITTNALSIIISRCEILGYFPSTFKLNNIRINNDTNIERFVDIVKNYSISKNDTLWLQFESWQDQDIDIPDKLYHVTKTKNLNRIKRYGLCPKSKNKISYHPDRIYFVDNFKFALNIYKQLNEIDYCVIEILPEKNILLLRSDPNYNQGYYTNQNIPPYWIVNITNLN